MWFGFAWRVYGEVSFKDYEEEVKELFLLLCVKGVAWHFFDKK